MAKAVFALLLWFLPQQRADFVMGEFLALIETHPDTQVRADFQRWMAEGRIQVLVDQTAGNALGCSMEPDAANPKAQKPTFWINDQFFRQTYLDPAEQSRRAVGMERYAAIVHEHTHLVNHFNGRHPLTVSPQTPAPRLAEFLWETEFEAALAEWKFLKRRGFPRVFMKREFRGYPEWEGFVRTVRLRLRISHDEPEYRAHFDRLMKRALSQPRS